MILLALLVGCIEAEAPGGPACASCHGSEESTAPPVALGGLTDPALIGIGAHQPHLTGARLGVPVACEECHLVPSRVEDPGHIDDPWPADVKWGELTKTGGLTVTWDHETATCSGSYCHGATLAGATLPDPVWTDPSGDAAACGACHGDPPPPPHPASDACESCHPKGPPTHLDGELQLLGDTTETGSPDTGTVSCEGCHGTGPELAPPPDTQGNTDPAFRGVGAHAEHVSGGNGRPVACEACHVVPATVGAAAHIDGGNAEVVFSGLAVAGGAVAAWDDVGLTCTAYCHGATLPGGDDTAPVWTTVDGQQARCRSCHGAPPPPPHPADSACADCHPTAGPSFTIVDPLRHVDGVLDEG